VNNFIVDGGTSAALCSVDSHAAAAAAAATLLL